MMDRFACFPCEVPVPRPFLPPAGNPMRPLFFMSAVFFPAVLIGFSLYVRSTGAPLGSAVGILALVGVVGIFAVGLSLWSGQDIERERRALAAGQAWASWRVSDDDYRRFVRAEWRRNVLWSLSLVAATSGVDVFLWLATGDARFGVPLLAFSLLFAAVIILAEMPPLTSNERVREVRIGEKGVEANGRYVRFGRGPRLLVAVGLLPGAPAVLLFRLGADRRRQDVRVPVPGDRLDEANAIVARFAPPTPDSYPELLRRERERRAAAAHSGAR